MEKFNGNYDLSKQINFIDHLIALGIPKEHIPKEEFSKQPLSIAVDGKKIVITNPKITANLILDEEVEEQRPNGSEKNLAKLDGDSLVVHTTRSNGATARKIYTLSGSELTVKFIDDRPSVPDAVRVFRKL